MSEEQDRGSPQHGGATGTSHRPEADSRAERLVAGLAEAFSDHGVSIADWRRVAAKAIASTSRDRFLRLRPEVAVTNVAGVSEHFAAYGLTPRQYLQAVLKRPLLLAQKPETLINNVEVVVRHFAGEALTTRDYVRAALNEPALWASKPETTTAKIEDVVRHFATEGLTLGEYLHSALKQPQLFCQSYETIVSNIDRVAEQFATDGLTRRAYLEAAVKLPQLFCRSPETIIEHANILAALHDKRLLPIPPGTEALMDFIVTHPMLLTLADDNLHLREIAAHIAQTRDAKAPMYANRPDVEETVTHALRHNDGDGSSEKVSHARRLLLSALRREGYLKER